MSRCFPYPPPGYVRNPVAVPPVPLVETTAKLQKEREKAEKKKEKRNDKKASHQGGDETKHSKRSHKKRKHEDTSNAGPESKTASKELFEQLEKSGLSEEHGAPNFIQTVHGSPESSQDSSKRRKVALPGQNKNETVLRIKIKRDQDSPSAMLDGSRGLQQPPVQQMATPSSLMSKTNAVQPRRDVMVKSAAGLQQSIKRDTQSVPKQMDVKNPATILQRVPSMTNIAPKMDPPTSAKIAQKIDPRVPVNATPSPAKVKGSADPLPTQLTRRVVPPPAKSAQRVDIPPAKVIDIATAKALQKVDPLVPSKVLRRDAPPPSLPVLQKETIKVAASHQLDRQQQPVLPKPKVPVGTPLIKQQQLSTLPKEEPCSSGRNTEKGAVPEVKQSKSDCKKSRKAEKKERKFRDLFVTWNPPSLEIEETGNLGDQDWLLGGAKKPDASNSSCKASDGLAPMELEFSWQPRAIHLPDLHVYQLPYVVPF